MDKVYYEEYFELERNHWWFRARKLIINSLLGKYSGKGNEVLNIGAATGETSNWLSNYGKVTSVEYEKDCCAFVKEKLNLDFIPASITELPFPDHHFDLVSAFDVIEHVQDDKLAVSEMFRVCKPGGLIAITVPAFMFMWSRHDDINHHQRRYVRKELKSLFKNLKGRILYASYFNTLLFFPVAATRLLAKLFPFIVRRKGSGSDFSYSGGSISSFLFFRIMKAESFFLKHGVSFPFGVSLILFFRKDK